MIHSIRRSNRAAKQLLWFLFEKDLKRSCNFDVGLDIACGDMYFYNFIKTKIYFGIDIDEERLSKAKKVYPNAKTVVSSIENLPPGLTGDFVVCMQAIGINTLFNINNTLVAVKKIVGATNPRGTLIFNIGMPCIKFQKEILFYLKNYFQNIKVVKYGNFNNEMNLNLALFLALIMRYLPFLRGGSSTYFFCEKRT